LKMLSILYKFLNPTQMFATILLCYLSIFLVSDKFVSRRLITCIGRVSWVADVIYVSIQSPKLHSRGYSLFLRVLPWSLLRSD
jgi:hypothetical protein